MAGFAILYPISRGNYLLFHALVESFSVVVAAGIFIVAWNTRFVSANRYLLAIGMTYLFVASIAMLHAFAYKGMGIFPQGGSNLPTQLWIIERVLAALGFLTAGISLRRAISVQGVFILFGGLTSLALASIWIVPVFPTMYVDGAGLTTAKVVSEYVIMVMFAGAFALLWRDRSRFEPRVARMLLLAIALMIAADAAFTLYVDVFGLLNFVGHYLVLISFVVIYRVLIYTVLREPYALLFREIKRREEAEHGIAEQLQNAILSVPDRVGGIEIEHAHVSATEGVRVGGDFWDVFSPAPGLVAFILGDICGKGIEAVASNVVVRATLRNLAYQDSSPCVVLARANDAVGRQLTDDKFATVIYGVIDVETGAITIASAGHPVPVLCIGGVPTVLEMPINPPLGVIRDYEFSAAVCALGDTSDLVFFSDGLIEAGCKTEMFGIDRVLSHLESAECRMRGKTAQMLLESCLAHAGGRVDDDVAIVVLRLEAAGV